MLADTDGILLALVAGRVRQGELGLSPLGPRVRPGRLAAPDGLPAVRSGSVRRAQKQRGRSRFYLPSLRRLDEATQKNGQCVYFVVTLNNGLKRHSRWPQEECSQGGSRKSVPTVTSSSGDKASALSSSPAPIKRSRNVSRTADDTGRI